MISVIIITLNEEKQIARCLNSVAWAQQIIVLDSGSTDNTVAIAKSLGAEVYVTDWPGYGPQKQRALSYARHEWVLSLDADEYLAVDASNVIQNAIVDSKYQAFRLPIRMIFQNKTMRYANSDNKHIRLFKKSRANFSSDLVHETVILQKNTKTKLLPAIILHESYEDWHDAVHKMNNYSSLSAKTGKKIGLIQALLASNWLFFRNYFLKRWCLDGTTGLLLAIYQSQGSWYRYIKGINPNVSA